MENEDLFKYIYTEYLEKANEQLLFTIDDWLDEVNTRGYPLSGGIFDISIPALKENLMSEICGVKTYYRDPENIGDYKYIGSYRVCEGIYNRYQLNVDYFINEVNEEELIEDFIERAKRELLESVIHSSLYRVVNSNENQPLKELIIVFNSLLGIHTEDENITVNPEMRFYVNIDTITPGMDIGKIMFHLPIFPYGTVQVFGK